MRFKILCLALALLVSNLIMPSNEALATNSSKIYTVHSGDCLSKISRITGISVKTIMKLNNMKNDKLQIGQKLLLSTQTTTKTSTNTNIAKTKNVKRTTNVSRGQSGQRLVGELIPWEEANKLYSQGKIANVYDLDSGLSFKVKRNYGHYHADSDPLTTNDTDVLRQIYSGSWSWDRRAVILEIDGRLLAASINGMPHGDKLVNNNNFPGHFCIHFLGSKTHGSGKVDAEHQKMVRKAAGQ